jgi:thymidine kinase
MEGAVGPAETAQGTVTLIVGCMFSGKTSALLREFAAHDGPGCLALKHADDVRYARDSIVSHGGQARPAIGVAAHSEILAWVEPQTTLIGVDDAHFFAEGLTATVMRLAVRGLHVTVTALDKDSWGRPFPGIERLASVIGRCVTLHATCARCGRRADRTQRLTPIRNGRLVGGRDDYEPRCAACWRPPPEPPPD